MASATCLQGLSSRHEATRGRRAAGRGVFGRGVRGPAERASRLSNSRRLQNCLPREIGGRISVNRSRARQARTLRVPARRLSAETGGETEVAQRSGAAGRAMAGGQVLSAASFRRPEAAANLNRYCRGVVRERVGSRPMPLNSPITRLGAAERPMSGSREGRRGTSGAADAQPGPALRPGRANQAQWQMPKSPRRRNQGPRCRRDAGFGEHVTWSVKRPDGFLARSVKNGPPRRSSRCALRGLD